MEENKTSDYARSTFQTAEVDFALLDKCCGLVRLGWCLTITERAYSVTEKPRLKMAYLML